MASQLWLGFDAVAWAAVTMHAGLESAALAAKWSKTRQPPCLLAWSNVDEALAAERQIAGLKPAMGFWLPGRLW